jgi:hypothetical protein
MAKANQSNKQRASIPHVEAGSAGPVLGSAELRRSRGLDSARNQLVGGPITQVSASVHLRELDADLLKVFDGQTT